MEVDLYKLLRDHIEDEQGRFEHIESLLEKLSTNELAHVKTALASVKSDLAWIKWLVLVVLGSAIANWADLLFGLLKK